MGTGPTRFRRVLETGAESDMERTIAQEVPVAIEYGGIGYAVLMATPADLVDLAYGFSLTERLIDNANHIVDVDCHRIDAGMLMRITLTTDVADRVEARVRHRSTDSSCGLCGIENLEQALRPLPRSTTKSYAEDRAIFRALKALPDAQPLNRLTGAVHAAAACSTDGDIRLVREDVGRHNAFDKVIGAMLRDRCGWDGGFALLSSRCSFELVEKAVLSGCPLLATISAPTTLALDRAAEAGLALRVLVRSDALLAATGR